MEKAKPNLTQSELTEHFNSAITLLTANQFSKAIDQFENLLKAGHKNHSIHHHLGLAYNSILDSKNALKHYNAALQFDDSCITTLLLTARLHLKLENYSEANRLLAIAQRADPNSVHVKLDYAELLLCERKAEIAKSHLLNLISSQPSMAEPWIKLGHAQCLLDDLQGATQSFEKALLISPNDAHAKNNLALTQLQQGKFKEGFNHYQWRLQSRLGQRSVQNPFSTKTSLPWPSEIENFGWQNKHILVLPEQGIGDELAFLRFVNIAQARGAKIDCFTHPKLKALLKNCCRELNTIDSLPNQNIYDHIMLVGDLPYLLGVEHDEDIPPSISLSIDKEKSTALNQILSKHPKPWTGITWRAGVIGDKLKKIMPFDLLEAQLNATSGTIFSLQRNPNDQDKSFCQNINAVDCSHLNDDLEAMLALLSQLDDYICVSNTNLHLRETLKLPCKVFIPPPGDFKLRQDQQGKFVWFDNLTRI